MTLVIRHHIHNTHRAHIDIRLSWDCIWTQYRDTAPGSFLDHIKVHFEVWYWDDNFTPRPRPEYQARSRLIKWGVRQYCCENSKECAHLIFQHEQVRSRMTKVLDLPPGTSVQLLNSHWFFRVPPPSFAYFSGFFEKQFKGPDCLAPALNKTFLKGLTLYCIHGRLMFHEDFWGIWLLWASELYNPPAWLTAAEWWDVWPVLCGL